MVGPTAQAPRYLVHEQLATGGMGEVYLGTQVTDAGRRRVAVKRLAADRQLDQAAMARLVAEGRLGFQLTHANICQVLDLVVGGERTYIVMEFVRGLDLRALLGRLEADDRPLEQPIALYVAREVARALDYAHRRTGADGRPLQIVHGDVTPPNILLSIEGEVKLADFGIARALDAAAPGSAVRGGTRGYMAPEVEGGAIDHRADIFSLGATLEEALARGGAASPELTAILRRATAADARDRYLSAADMERALALELARRWPGFTPSALAELVRACMVPVERAESDAPGEPKTLFELESRMTPAAGDARATRTATAPRPRRARRRALLALALCGAAGVSAAVFANRGDAPEPVDTPATEPRRVPPPEPVDTPATEPRRAPPPSGDPAPPSSAPSSPRAASDRPEQPASKRRSQRARRAFLTVNSSPWGAVYVDGEPVAKETPLYRHPVAPGVHRVTIYYPDLRRHSSPRTVRLAPDEHRTIGFER